MGMESAGLPKRGVMGPSGEKRADCGDGTLLTRKVTPVICCFDKAVAVEPRERKLEFHTAKPPLGPTVWICYDGTSPRFSHQRWPGSRL